jgi:hypothetical protein
LCVNKLFSLMFKTIISNSYFASFYKQFAMKQQPATKLLAIVITVFLLCLGCSISSFAQFSIGVEGGYTRNYLETNNANRDFTNYKPADGFTIGIPVQYKIVNWFAIAADPAYIQKNYVQERSSYYEGTYQISTNSYLQLPVMAHFMFGGQKLQGFFNLGGFAGYWLDGNVKGRMPNILDPVDSVTASNTIYYQLSNSYSYDEKYTFDTHRDNRIDAGWIAGAGVSYVISSKYTVFAEGRVIQSLTDMQKNYMINQTPRYNNTYNANLGIMINLGKQTTNNN